MTEIKIEYFVVAVSTFLLPCVAAQEQYNACYGPGSIVGAVIGTLIITLGIVCAGLFFYRTYWKNRKGKHLVLVTDTENPNDQYAFDNPCFREAPAIKQNISDEKQTSKLDKNKWLGWTSLHSFGKDHKKEKITSLDDNNMNDSRLRVVTLKSHDFTGLGFNICGNMRDGIFVKDVLHRGPAFESGCINSGDRIHSVCINFKNMVFEDALMILSYASPYDVQVQIENDSNASKPSTLLKSKRESNLVSSSEKICHPKYNRSQSISYLNEIGKTNNKQLAQQIGFMQEKNRINQSLNKFHENKGNSNDYPTIKLSPRINEPKKERQFPQKNAASINSHSPDSKKLTNSNTPEKQVTPDHGRDLQNKFQKFGIKVLPMSNPKMGVQSVTGSKKSNDEQSSPKGDNKINLIKEKPEKPSVDETLSSSLPRDSTKNEYLSSDETDMAKENVKTIFSKGFHNLKEKINQNSLGKKKSKDTANESKDIIENHNDDKANDIESDGGKELFAQRNINLGKSSEKSSENDCPVPKLRSNLPCGTKAYEKSQQNQSLPTIITMPEEVSKAGDVAKSNRRSITDPSNMNSRKSLSNVNMTLNEENLNLTPTKEKTQKKKCENGSESESSSDIDLPKLSEDTKRPKKSKGKAPAPPGCDSAKEEKPTFCKESSTNEISKINEKSELVKGEKSDIFEPLQTDAQIIRFKKDMEDVQEKNHFSTYDSDSDTEAIDNNSSERANSVKIELNATQVTIHQSSIEEGNDEEVEPSRKAASLGDLSRLDSEQPLSIVLERAVSLDLADGTSQKKRKAPMPPSEEFPTVFDDLNYRKEPRLEHPLGLNSFQCRLKKSSDFGTLEDVLNDGPKSLEIEINKPSLPINLTETHNNNIQEFSSWLAECRRPKSIDENNSKEKSTTPTIVTSTSLVNINSFDNLNNNSAVKEVSRNIDCQGSNVSFSVNGKNFSDFKGNDSLTMEEQEINFPGANSKTVVVISQPNSLEPTVVETMPMNFENDKEKSSLLSTEVNKTATLGEEDTTIEPFVTARDFSIENFKEDYSDVGDTPPRLPTSPMPVLTTSSTVSSPLSSSLTYITEIKVSTSQLGDPKDSSATKSDSPLPSPSSDHFQHLSFDIVSSTPLKISEKPEKSKTLSEKIQQFDNKLNEIKPSISPIKPKPIIVSSENKTNTDFPDRENFRSMETSKIPIRTMKSETGQKVLATIQSLAAKKMSPTKSPEVEYAKRMASLFSGNNSLDKTKLNFSKETEEMKNDDDRPNVSGFYLKGPEITSPKPSKDFLAMRKVPPVVPPRKMETFISENKVTGVSLDIASKNQEIFNDKPGKTLEKNIVTFSSYPNNLNEESGNSTTISFKIKNHGQVNGSHSHEPCNVIPVKPYTPNIVFENKGHKDNF